MPSPHLSVADYGAADVSSIDTLATAASTLARPTSSNSSPHRDQKPTFNYDLDVFNQCRTYLHDRNHHGLALIARQKGLPPFLRFKVWPILLKWHPFVLNPFIQPDSDAVNDAEASSESVATDSEDNHASVEESKEETLRNHIRKDLRRYIQRLKFSSASNTTTSNNTSHNSPTSGVISNSAYSDLNEIDMAIFDILERAILKFVTKWGQIIKYDPALTWIALGLAEWSPPIPHTPWVLVGRDTPLTNNSCVKNLMDDYSTYIDNIPLLDSYLLDLIMDDTLPSLQFHEMYERLALVILHSPDERHRKSSVVSSNGLKSGDEAAGNITINKSLLPINGGTIEERVSFFIYVLRKLLPELSQYFQEEQILNKFGSHDDEWLIWWLKYCGSKVWSRLDRGRIWDLMIGWRLQNKKNQRKNKNYYPDKMNIKNTVLDKLGPDIFWSVGDAEGLESECRKSDSFKDLMNDLHINEGPSKDASSHHSSGATSSSSSSNNSNANLPILASKDSSSATSSITEAQVQQIPFAKLDPHIELMFVTLALLKSKENVLVELDQHEIRQFLSRLPTKSYNASDRYKQYKEQKNKERQQKEPVEPVAENNPTLITNDPTNTYKADFMDNIINEAGELWRTWLWKEMADDD